MEYPGKVGQGWKESRKPELCIQKSGKVVHDNDDDDDQSLINEGPLANVS